MIKAKIARELSDNITSSAAQKQLKQLDAIVLAAAAAGLFKVDVTKEEILPCVEHYLYYIGYQIKKVTDEHQYVLKFEICW